jgi:hypothetical protein
MANIKDIKKDEKRIRGREKRPGDKINVDPKKIPPQTDSDVEPDEFIGTNADTDQPLDGQVTNDAVLRGEPHADDNLANYDPSQVKE